MSIKAGTRIGPYEVTSPLGEGGMGVVFRAHDTKLQRDVALKLLPDHFADDPERLARFEREARVLASLNHPNIAQIHGLEESENTRCIVMELVEGATVQERLKRGPIPIDEALQIAKQIADALEAAHERGIIHRDLKPANIKLTPDGTVKVLDFGLAKALASEDVHVDVSNFPDDGQRVACRHDRRQSRLHGPGAGSRPTRGQAGRYLGVRVRALRTAHRRAGVRRPGRFGGVRGAHP
jgi:serine/threonine protein kinase